MRFEALKELWRYRELLYFFAWREIKVRYKQAALGAAWAVIQPLMTMVVFTLFFGRMLNIQSPGAPYPVFVYCALLPWIYFSGVVSQSGTSLVGNANLITKVYFPRILLPASTAVAALLDFVIGGGVAVLLLIYFGVRPTWMLAWLPLFIGVLVVITFGLSTLFSALNVRFRDVKHVIPFLLQLWFFCTPIVYPSSDIAARYKTLLALNPLVGIVEGFRACLFRQTPIDVWATSVSVVMAIGVFVVGIVYFRRTERVFADII